MLGVLVLKLKALGIFETVLLQIIIRFGQNRNSSFLTEHINVDGEKNPHHYSSILVRVPSIIILFFERSEPEKYLEIEIY